MLTIPNLPTQDAYVEALTLGPAPTARMIKYVVANKAVFMRVWPQSKSGTIPAQTDELLVTPETNVITDAMGVQFRSAVPGVPAQVVAQLLEPGDPTFGSGTPFSSIISGSGGITPGASAVQIQKDGALIATEQAIDFLIANQVPRPGLGLVAADDPANTRVLLSLFLASQLGYAEFTSNVIANGVAEAAATSMVTLPAINFDGSTMVDIEFECAAVVWGGTVTGGINLWDNGVDKGRLLDASSVLGSGSGATSGAFFRRRLIPTAGNHTYSARIWNTVASNLQATAGAGGAGTPLPGSLRARVAS